MAPILKKLKKHYPLYLISNTNQLHFDYVKKKFRILKYFDRVFPSHEVGHRKPESKIYKKVLKKIKLAANKTIFIDDVPKFVQGAKKVGMHAVRFRNPEKLIRDLRKLGIRI